MQEQVEKIEIILENCEVITVEGKYIGDLNCDDITYSIVRSASNYIGEEYTCNNFSMSIHRDCNLNNKSEWIVGVLDEKREPLKRIEEYNDITSIYIYFTKDEEHPRQLYVKWGGDSEYNNIYQKSYMNKFGDLFIVIGKDLDIEDIFDKEEIEDEDNMNFIWEMYS